MAKDEYKTGQDFGDVPVDIRSAATAAKHIGDPMKGLLCLILGHRRARLEGLYGPAMSISTPESGLVLRFEFCDRCGALWGSTRVIGISEVEKVHLLSISKGK